jgi:hypothetical protein
MKQYILVIISMFLVSCFSNKKLIFEDEFEISHKKIYIIDVNKKKHYYLIKAIDNLKDTISVISYTKKPIFEAKRNEKELRIKVGKNYDFELIKIYTKVVNGVPSIGHIIIKKDTLWRGNIILNKDLRKKEPQFYGSLNSKGLIIYN